MRTRTIGFACIALLVASNLGAQTDTLFAVRFTTGPKWDSAKAPNEQAFFAEHSANLSRLRKDGVLVIGARYGEVGLVVLRLPDEDAVKTQLALDPSIEAGTFVATIDRFMPFMHGSTQAPLTTPEAVALRAYYDAFNRHEADGTAAFLAEGVKWYSVSGDTQSLDGNGRAAIRDWLAGYFKQLPDVKSDVLELRQTGPHLFVHERVSWMSTSGAAKRASALAIYEVRDGLIQRVWYFPPGE
jgi:hypothetical protein